MSLADGIIIGLFAAVAFFYFLRRKKHKQHNRCSGCCHGCSHASWDQK